MTDIDPLIEAIRGQRAAEFAEGVLGEKHAGDRETAQAVKNACGAISAQMREVRHALCLAMRNEGIDAEEVVGPEDTGALQFHLATISLPAIAAPAAVIIAEAQGFRLPFQSSTTQLVAISRYLPQLMLVREDEATARIRIILSNQSTRLPNKLRPSMADIATAGASTPVGFYPVLRVGRAIRDKILGRRHALSDTDFIGTPTDLIAPILQKLHPGKEDTVLDLGCGDGRILFVAASQFECNAVGIESNPDLVSEAQRKLQSVAPDIRARIRIDQGFAERADLTGATVIFLFLPGYLFSKIFPSVLERAEPGTRIVAHEQAPLTGITQPDKTVAVVGPASITVANIWTKKPV